VSGRGGKGWKGVLLPLPPDAQISLFWLERTFAAKTENIFLFFKMREKKFF
jgi:hypothetical protein